MNLRSKIPFLLASIKRDKTQPIWLEYLQSDSTAFIDTGVSGNNNNLSLNMTFYVENFYEYFGIFGNYIDENTNVFRVIGSESSNKLYLNTNTRAGSADVRNLSNFYGSKHTLRLVRTKLILDGVSSSVRIINGTANDTNIALFNRSVANPFPDVRDAGLKIYSCQMYDGDVMIRDFRPCLHPKTLQPCMYDMVTKQYFFNAGTGQFQYEYTFDTLEYIESTGTQYIDTGIIGKNGVKVYVDFSVSDTSVTNFIIGSRTTSITNGRFYLCTYVSGTPAFAMSIGVDYRVGNPVANTKYNAIFDTSISPAKLTINDSLSTTASGTIDTALNMFLFASNRDGNPQYGGGKPITIYKTIIYENGILIADYIPVRRLDGTVCMYDFISGEFKVNSGSGAFVAGGYVQNLEDYEKLEYLQSDGNCYIDTGIFLGYDSKAILRVKTVNLSIAQLAFGNNISGENFTCNIGNNNINVSRFDGAKYTGSLYKDNVNVHTYTVDKSGIQVDDSIFAWDTTPTNFEPTLSSYLFANRALTGAANFVRAGTRVYDFKVYENEKLIQYLISVKRKSDGVKGMLDMVSGAFLTNQGTGEFE